MGVIVVQDLFRDDPWNLEHMLTKAAMIAITRIGTRVERHIHDISVYISKQASKQGTRIIIFFVWLWNGGLLIIHKATFI